MGSKKNIMCFFSGVSEKKWFWLILTVVYAVIPVILYFESIAANNILVAGDGYGAYEIFNYQNEMLRNGEFPLWNKYYEAGMPYGMYNYNGLYLIGILLSFLPIYEFTYVFYFIHLIIAALFMYLFLKEINCSTLAAVIVSVLYETSVHMGGARKEHVVLIVGYAYVPVVLYLIEKYLNTDKLIFLIMSALAMCFQFLGSHAQIAFYSDVVVFFYLLIGLINRRKPVKKSICHGLLWFFSYVLLILAQLWTLIRYMMDASRLGGSMGYSKDIFSLFSLTPSNFLQMLFPELFEDIQVTLGAKATSGMDIELFLGFIVFWCILFCAVKLIKYFHVRCSLALMTVIIIYCAVGNIPFLRDIVFEFPIVNSFRLPSRALFLFIFFEYVLAAICLTRLKEKDILEDFAGFIKKAALIVLLGITSVYIANFALFEDQYPEQLDKIFGSAFWICLILIAISGIYKKFSPSSHKAAAFFAAFLFVVTEVQVIPFSIYRNELSGDVYESKSSVLSEIAQTNYKVLGVENIALHEQVMSLGAYMTYNQPQLYRMLFGVPVSSNSSGSMLGLANNEHILRQKNNVLSVLGVRYIYDSAKVLDSSPDFMMVSPGDIDSSMICNRISDYTFTSGQSMFDDPVQLKNNHRYYVKATIELENAPDVIYFDVYSAVAGVYFVHTPTLKKGSNDVQFLFDTTGAEEGTSWFQCVSLAENTPWLLKNMQIYDMGNVYANGERLLEEAGITIPASIGGGYSLVSWPVELEQNTDYVMCLTAAAEQSPELFYADVYSNDSLVQQIIAPTADEREYSLVFNSGDIPRDTWLRIVSVSDSDVTVSSLVLSEYNTNSYQYFTTDETVGNTDVYTNPNAKDILFSVEAVEPVSDNEKLYSASLFYDMLNTAYVENIDCSMSKVERVNISGIDFGTNKLTAYAECASDSFLCFSQCYDEGWKAYVDEKETEVYLVDGVIMGIDVPAGSHNIEFRYSIPLFVPLLCLSLLVTIFWLTYFVLCFFRKRKNAKADKEGSRKY